MRQRFIAITAAALMCFQVVATPGASEGPGAPYGLLCDLLRAPAEAVITDPVPEFGWIVNDQKRGARQSAHRILVATSSEGIGNNSGDMWDSGKVPSGQSVNVEYGGRPLNPNATYWWKVKTWNASGKESPYSSPQKFRTGTFSGENRSWPAESKYVKTEGNKWLLENRQRASYHEIPPEQIIKISPGSYFIDFGKAAFATLRLTLKSNTEGHVVTVFLGERRRGNRVHKKPGRTNIGFKKAALTLKKGTHTYTLKLPRHISHYPNSQVLPGHMYEVTPFRYAELVETPSKIISENIRQLALYYYFDDNASHLTTSNENLNRVWELCKYTLKTTPFLSLYADGNRERMPYEADAHIQQLGHCSVDREYSVARYTYQFLIFNPAWPTEWHMHNVLMAWYDYMQTGNTESIERFYDELKAKTLLALAGPNHLISTRTGLVTKEFLKTIHYKGNQFADIVDWPPGTPSGKKDVPEYYAHSRHGERDGYVFKPYNTVVNAFHYRTLAVMADMAKAAGKKGEAAFFRKRARKVKKQFNDTFLDKERGIYVDGKGTDHASLHANMFPLAFNLVPSKYVPSVVRHIKSRGIACSVYGAQYLLDGLYNAGQSQYALSLMTSESKRSWMNMIRAGSTMTTEAWDEAFKPNLTWNHAWGSAPANIIPRRLMGIQPLRPAFRKVRIKPQPGPLELVKLKTPTIRGAIHTAWKAENGRFSLEVTIPANTEAVIWLPCSSPGLLKEGNRKIENRKDITIKGKKEGYVLCKTGSGRYLFSGKRERQ